jgi:hemerythrin HHE cation binding domain-containing protein
MARKEAPSRRSAQGSERQSRTQRRKPDRRTSARAARHQGAPSALRSAGSAVAKMLRGSTETVKEAGATVIGTAREVITAAATARHDAVSVLKAQHREVEALFEKVLESDDPRARRELLQQIGDALTLHTKIEEDIFYPAVRGLGDEETQTLLDEALEEHHVVDLVLGELPGVNPRDERFTAKMTVLSELVEHHVKEEERDMFKRAQGLGKERLEALGARLEAASARHRSSASRSGERRE